MKTTIDGKEVDVFTQEDLDEKIKTAEEKAIATATKVAEDASAKAIEEFKTNNPDNTEEMDSLKSELAEANTKLEEFDTGDEGDSEQIKRLKKSAADAEKKAEEKIANELGDMKKSIDEFKTVVTGDTKKEALDKLSDGDADLRAKLELTYNDRFAGEAKTKEEITQRATDAFKLVGTGEMPNIMDSIIGTGGSKGDGNVEKDKYVMSEEGKKAGNNLGISEADREKYGPIIDNKKE